MHILLHEPFIEKKQKNKKQKTKKKNKLAVPHESLEKQNKQTKTKQKQNNKKKTTKKIIKIKTSMMSQTRNSYPLRAVDYDK